MSIYPGINLYPPDRGGIFPYQQRDWLILNKTTVQTFTVQATGFRFGSATVRDEHQVIFTGRRSWNLVIFNKSAGRISSVSKKYYDLYENSLAAAAMNADIAAIPAGTDICIFTHDEPSGNKEKITEALLTLGATRKAIRDLIFRGVYILTGTKGMLPGQGREYTASTGKIQATIEFINGVMKPQK